jgi:hypothetical protein
VGSMKPAPGTDAASLYSFPRLPEHGWACREGITWALDRVGETAVGVPGSHQQVANHPNQVARDTGNVWAMWLGWAGPGAWFYGVSEYDGSGTGVGGFPQHPSQRRDGSMFGNDRGAGYGCPFNHHYGRGRGDGDYVEAVKRP